MCGVCGCSDNSISHTHEHHHHHPEEKALIKIEQDVLAKNNNFATTNRSYFTKREILVLNLVSSPGSGKTTLLEKTIINLQENFPISVIEGDQQTELDAERIAKTNAPVLQINTGKVCHLDAHMIGHAIEKLPLVDNSILFIENVGNLVCPALFDLGEAHRIVILSVTEGDDKPLKYPYMFHGSDLMILNKIDLLPYVDFDVSKCVENAKKINPKIEFLSVSATNGEGLTQWYQWLAQKKVNNE